MRNHNFVSTMNDTVVIDQQGRCIVAANSLLRKHEAYSITACACKNGINAVSYNDTRLLSYSHLKSLYNAKILITGDLYTRAFMQ